MSEYHIRKVETLIKCLVSIDNVLLKDFPEVKTAISNSISVEDAIKQEILTWDSTITDKIYAYYLQFVKEHNDEIDKDINFQSSLS